MFKNFLDNLEEQGITRKKILIALVLLAVFIGLLALYNLLFFRIASEPDYTSRSKTDLKLEIKFNRQLASEKTEAVVTGLEPSEYQIDVENKSLYITLFEAPYSNTELNLYADVYSTNGDNIQFYRNITFSKKTELEYTQENVEASGRLTDSYPLMAELPMISTYYSIYSEFPDAGSFKAPIIVSHVKNINFSESDNSKANKTHRKKQYQLAVKWLNENGFNEEQYELYFEQDSYLEEFNAKLWPRDRPVNRATVE